MPVVAQKKRGINVKKKLKKLKGNYVGNYFTYCFLCCKCPGKTYINEKGRRLDDRLNVHHLDVAPLLPSRFSSRDRRL